MKKKIRGYADLSYPYLLERDAETQEWAAVHPDLPGCVASGDTADAAVANLDEARQLWIETRLEFGLHVPDPPSEEFSGRLSLRMPSSLHEELASMATRRGCSLNLLLNTALAAFVGARGTEKEIKEVVREELQAWKQEAESAYASLLRGLAERPQPVSTGAAADPVLQASVGSRQLVSTGDPDLKLVQGGVQDT